MASGGAIVRQTMFAEFEKITHALVESGEPLTVDALRREYRKLLDLYFGPEFVIDIETEDWNAQAQFPISTGRFMLYKYATGLSAAIALSERVTSGGATELNEYLTFLKGGCSKYPLDLLRDAGVDMETPMAVDAAMQYFKNLVMELEELLSIEKFQRNNCKAKRAAAAGQERTAAAEGDFKDPRQFCGMSMFIFRRSRSQWVESL